jgi:heterotetrameric sarcosine oxidase delta subunit
MIVPCPHCGPRDSGEFHFRGEATGPRPAYEDGVAAFVDHVYGRANIAGAQKEHWYHSAGCRRWLLVERDTRSHAFLSVLPAAEIDR